MKCRCIIYSNNNIFGITKFMYLVKTFLVLVQGLIFIHQNRRFDRQRRVEGYIIYPSLFKKNNSFQISDIDRRAKAESRSGKQTLLLFERMQKLQQLLSRLGSSLLNLLRKDTRSKKVVNF